MKLKSFTLGVVLAGTLVGCGGVEGEETAAPAQTATRADAMVLPCDGSQTWEYTYYSGTTAVGGQWCDCSGVIATWGTKTGTYNLTRGQCY